MEVERIKIEEVIDKRLDSDREITDEEVNKLRNEIEGVRNEIKQEKEEVNRIWNEVEDIKRSLNKLEKMWKYERKKGWKIGEELLALRQKKGKGRWIWRN